MKSCAICARPIAGEPLYEPLGKDDALVPCCKRCIGEEVVPKERVSTVSMREYPRLNERPGLTAWRKRLAELGLCRNGESHGPALRGRKICQRCLDRARVNSQRRRDAKRAA